MLKFIIIVIALAAFGYYAYINFDDAFHEDRDRAIACTLEARVCPDGSTVGRTGPNCEFSACPGE